jgi:hypothetical protein
MIIADYFAGLERTLRRNPQVSELEGPFTCLASDDYNGLVRGPCLLLGWLLPRHLRGDQHRAGLPDTHQLRVHVSQRRQAHIPLR